MIPLISRHQTRDITHIHTQHHHLYTTRSESSNGDKSGSATARKGDKSAYRSASGMEITFKWVTLSTGGMQENQVLYTGGMQDQQVLYTGGMRENRVLHTGGIRDNQVLHTGCRKSVSRY